MYQSRDCLIPCDLYQKHATIYTDPSVIQKAYVLYFHGGGLFYGSRHDLPELHKHTLTENGYTIISFDYPLAPAAKLDTIVSDVLASLHDYLTLLTPEQDPSLPYFLFGRSAGAYLSLIAGSRDTLFRKPAGIVSYYGYGFLVDRWFSSPSQYYCALPPVPASCMEHIPKEIHAEGSLDTHFSVYVYARQQGKWRDLIFDGRHKFFFRDYSLRTVDHLPCPLLVAHNGGDNDVPFAEFQQLCRLYDPVRFITVAEDHDFDRHEDDPATKQLLEKTLHFLDGIYEQAAPDLF